MLTLFVLSLGACAKGKVYIYEINTYHDGGFIYFYRQKELSPDGYFTGYDGEIYINNKKLSITCQRGLGKGISAYWDKHYKHKAVHYENFRDQNGKLIKKLTYTDIHGNVVDTSSSLCILKDPNYDFFIENCLRENDDDNIYEMVGIIYNTMSKEGRLHPNSHFCLSPQGHIIDKDYYVRVISPNKVRTHGMADSIGVSISSVKSILSKGEKLAVAMNGGMIANYDSWAPVGLYIENGICKHGKVNPSGTGNYNMRFGEEEINGIFLIDTKGAASIVNSKTQLCYDSIRYATQSGPLLVYEGEVNPNFNQESTNICSRNGIGVTSNGDIVMIYSPKTNFYDLASLFKNIYYCTDALYLDGVISQMYLPECGLTDQSNRFAVVIYGIE